MAVPSSWPTLDLRHPTCTPPISDAAQPFICHQVYFFPLSPPVPPPTLLTQLSECQQSSSRPYACYASAPNDIWSLGVILVNLTCGRNPWKKASPEDSTFRAYLKDSKFLRTILPLSSELDSILRHVFECDPQKRISIQKLRELIVACPRLTNTPYSTLPPTPPPQPYEYVDTYEAP